MNAVLHDTPEAYEAEYRRIKGELIARGSSLNQWLNEHGYSRQFAYKALKGKSFSRKGIELRRQIVRDVLGEGATR